MVAFRILRMSLATAVAVCGLCSMSVAFDHDEHERPGHHDSGDSDGDESEHHGSGHDDAQHEATEHGTTSSTTTTSSAGTSSSSGGASTTTSSASTPNSNGRDDSVGEGVSGDDSRQTSSSTTSSSGEASGQTPPRTSSRLLTSRTTISQQATTHRKLRLITGVGGRGEANYKISATNRSLEVHLRNPNVRPGQTPSVLINGITVGQMTVIRVGRDTKATLKLDLRRGSSVSTIASNAIVSIVP